jgi:membrane-associated protein
MSFLNPEHLIQSGGLLLIGLIVFAESGLLIGFFLPGDTLLLSAGFFAAQGKLPLIGVIGIVIVAAIAGDNLGYHIGRRTGHRIFRKKDGIIFRQEYLETIINFLKISKIS